MTIDQFWDIVGSVHVAAGGDHERECELIGEKLRQLSPEEVGSFSAHYDRLYYQAFSWPLWDAASLICGGCGDDSFMDFRNNLISMGRGIFEKAMANPDSLAESDLNRDNARFEEYAYAINEACEDAMNREGGGACGFRDRGGRHPETPAGIHCEEWELEQRFPRLAAKYGHKDADYLHKKEHVERWKQLKASRQKSSGSNPSA